MNLEDSYLHDAISIIDKRIDGMKSYLNLRLSLEDWHGVQDAASDIRELVAQKHILVGLLNRSVPKE